MIFDDPKSSSAQSTSTSIFGAAKNIHGNLLYTRYKCRFDIGFLLEEKVKKDTFVSTVTLQVLPILVLSSCKTTSEDTFLAVTTIPNSQSAILHS